MNYLSTTGKLSQFTQLIWVMSLAFFLCWFSLPAQGVWDLDYTLPVNAQNYPRAPDGKEKFSINAAYEVMQAVWQRQTLRFKVLIPPGASKAQISAQSLAWQCAPDISDGRGNIIVPQSERCPIMSGFDHDPGAFCPNNPTNANPTPCGEGAKVYPKDLHTVTARLLDILYPTKPDSPDVVTQPRYAYFVLYQQPQALDKFAFTSNLGISFGISDVGLYNQWVDSGRAEVFGNTRTLTVTPTPTGGTVNSNKRGINCGNGGAACSEDYTTGEIATLTATPKPGFNFDGWRGNGECEKGGTTNPLSITMDAAKNCSATFSAIPVVLTVKVQGEGAVINYFHNDKKRILCGLVFTNCTANYAQGDNVILVAVPNPGFTLERWGDDCEQEPDKTMSYISVVMDRNKTCSAIISQ